MRNWVGLGAAMAALTGLGCSSDDGGTMRMTGTGGAVAPTGGTAGPAGGMSGVSGVPVGGMSGMAPTGGMAGAPSGGSGGAPSGGSGGAPSGGSGGGEPLPPSGDCAIDLTAADACRPSAEGIYAIKTRIDVWWQDDAVPPLVDSGRDYINVYLRGEISSVQDNGSGTGSVKPCGTELPPFKSDANCDVFQIEIPDEVWDQPGIPVIETTGMSSGFNIGDTLTLATATGLVGIELNDPDGAWPQSTETTTFACPSGTGQACFPDHDGDGKPGITIRMGRIGETYSTGNCGGFNLDFVYRGAPLDALGALDDNGVKAETLYIGLRSRIGGGGTIGGCCDSGTGDSTAEFLDSRVINCVTTSGADCLPAQAQFVDDQAPTYNILDKGEAPPPSVMTMGLNPMPLDQTPSTGTVSAVVRIGDLGSSVSCSDVRGAPFPSF